MIYTQNLKHLSMTCVVAVAACFAAPALAQKDGRINSRQVSGYAELLAMDEEQTEIALLLFSDYIEHIEVAANLHRNAVEDLKKDSENGKIDPVMAEAWFKINQNHEKEVAKTEDAFFDDLRLMLNEDQAAQWPRVERKRRRETTLRRGWLSGESVDLITMTHSFMGERPISPEMAGAIDSYELQLDKALITKQRIMDDMLNKVANPKRSLGEGDYQEMGETKQTVGIPVRDLNHRHVRIIEGLMPDDLADEYHNEWLKRAFPRIYRESKLDRLFKAVGEISDLSDEQRQTTNTLLASFTRQRAAANKALTTAIIDNENNPEQGGGGKGQRPTSDTPPTAIQKAVAARKAIDERYEEKVRAVLTSDQEDNLPSLKDPKARQQGKSSGKGR